MFSINTLMCMGFYMLMPILPVYAVHDIGLDEGMVGFVIGVFAISSVIGRPISGFSVDRYGRMIVFIPAFIVFTLCFGSYVFATAVFSLLLVRLVHGFSWGVTNTAGATVVADIIPQNLRSQGIGYFGLSMTAAMAIGPSLGVFLTDHFSIKGIFGFSMLLCAIGVGMSFFLKPPKIQRDNKSFNVKNLFEKRVAGIAFIEFFFGFIYISVMSYATLHGLELHIKGMSVFFLIYALAMAVTRPLGGRVMAKYGPTPLLTSGLASFALGLLMLAFAKGELAFMASGSFLGIGGGFIMPTIMTMAINVVIPQRRGAANATIFTALDIGIGLGAVLFGFVAKRIGYEGMYIIAACVVAVPALIYFLKVARSYRFMREEVLEGRF